MPNQATNTTTGNWRARYASEFYDAQGREWRVEVIDSETTSIAASEFNLSPSDAPHDVELTSDGFNLSWDGPSDHIGGTLIPSSCEITLAISTSAMEPLVSIIKSSNDRRFGLAVYYDDGSSNWKPYWVGTLNHEAIEYELKDRPYLVTLSASCGLQRLGDIEFADDGDAYLDQMSLAEVVATCLNKIPTANFWNGSEYQLNEVVDLYNDGHLATSNWTSTTGDAFPAGVLERTVVNAATFSKRKEGKTDKYDRRVAKPRDFNSCRDVLEEIAIALGARMFLTRFGWWVFPPNAYNWSHTLRVQKWTRTQVATETIQTTLSGSLNVNTSTSEDINFEQDVETNHALGDGWANSYLLPVKRATVTLTDAGQRSVFGIPRNFYLDYPNSGSGTKGFGNANLVVSEGDTFNIRGTYTSGDLVKEFGNYPNSFDDYGQDRVGARIVLRCKIKVGSLYYGSEYTVDTENTSIDMPTGYGDIAFKRLFVPTPSWSTDEKFFDIIIPWTHSTPPAEVENSQGWVRVGGLHIRATQNGEFEYKVNGTQQDDVAHDIDFITVPLPSTSSSYTGVEVTFDRIVVTAAGAVRQTFPQLENIFQSVAIVNYDSTGSDLASYSQSAPADRLDNMVVGIGNNSDDADVDVFVEQTSNTEFIDLGETSLGDNTVSGVPQSDGALSVIQYGVNSITPFLTTTGWNSVTDSVSGDDQPTELLLAMCREHLFMRGNVMGVQRGTIVPKHSTASNTSAPMDMLTVMKHNCSTQSDLVEYLVPMRLSMTGGPATLDVDAFVKSRQRMSHEEAEDVKGKGKGDGGSGGGPNGGVAPVGAIGSSSTETIDSFAQDKIAEAYDDITAIQTKTDNITVTQAVNLDTIESQVGTNVTNIATNASGVATNASDITSVETDVTSIQNVLKSTFTGGGAGVYSDSSKNTTSSFMGLTSTTAKLQAGAGNTAIDLEESSPGHIEMSVQVGPSGSEQSATAIDIQGTTGSQLPDITFSGNITGIDLDDMDDVNAPSPGDGEVLTWDNSTSKWTAQTSSGGGGNAFGTIAVSGQSNVVADATNDTLTLAAGTNAVLTTDATTDEVTIGVNSSPTFTNIVATGSVAAVGNIGSITGNISGVGGTFTGDATFGGDATISGDLYTTNLNFIGGGTSAIGPSSVTGSSPPDLEIQSNGNVTVVLDYDSNEAAQAFIVKNQAGTTIFQVDEDGVSSGLLTTVTPTVSGVSASYSQAGAVSGISISNHSAGRTYEAKIYNSSGVEQTVNPVTVDSSGNVTFNAPSTVATGYELRIFAADVGKLRSVITTSTFAVIPTRNFSHWRFQTYTSGGSVSTQKAYIGDIRLFTLANSGGTEYPTTSLTSNTSESGITLSSGYQHSSGYAPWKVGDVHTYTGFWTIGNTTAANAWVQIEFATATTLGSITVTTNASFTDATNIKVFGSNTGNFSGEEIEVADFSGVGTGSNLITFSQNI